MSLRFDIRVGLGVVAICGTLNGCCGGDDDDGDTTTTFFVTSDTRGNGDLGGLDGADQRCNDLAKGAKLKGHVFHAYLSTSGVNANRRIGDRKWQNKHGDVIAESLAALHDGSLVGSPTKFVTEKGNPVPSEEHAILTGSMPDGTVKADKTCGDWASTTGKGQVGHSDGEGPNMNTNPPFNSWNSAAEVNCADMKNGGSGRIYCFASD